MEYLKKNVLEILLQSLKGILKQTEHLISARQNFALDQESALQTRSKCCVRGGDARGDLFFYYNAGSDFVFFPLAEVQSEALSKLTNFKGKVN